MTTDPFPSAAVLPVTARVPHGTKAVLKQLKPLFKAERGRARLLAGDERWSVEGLSGRQAAERRAEWYVHREQPRQEGELLDCLDALVMLEVRGELRRRGWDHPWPELPWQALIPGRWPGSRDGGYPEKVPVRLAAALVTQAWSACWHTSSCRSSLGCIRLRFAWFASLAPAAVWPVPVLVLVLVLVQRRRIELGFAGHGSWFRYERGRRRAPWNSRGPADPGHGLVVVRNELSDGDGGHLVVQAADVCEERLGQQDMVGFQVVREVLAPQPGAVGHQRRASRRVPMGIAGDDVMSGFHDVDQDVAGVQEVHQIRLVRHADGPDGIADRSVRLTGAVVEFVVEAQQSQHCRSFYKPFRLAGTGRCGHR